MKDIELIPELAQWQSDNSDSFSIVDWTAIQVTPELMIGVASILWPRFIFEHGGVFLADGYSSDSFQSWFERSNHDLYAVQSLLNHRHISDMFLQGSDAKPSRIQLEYIGQLLVEMWSSKLHREFPNLQIHVELLNFDSDDLVSPAITFGVVNSH